jgi:hypothetical protein
VSKQRHTIELAWDDEQLSADSVHGVLDGEPVAGPTVVAVFLEMARRLTGEGTPMCTVGSCSCF